MINLEIGARMIAERSEKTANGCQLWTRGRDWDGYGIVRIESVSYRAHRVAWAVANSTQPPQGLVIRHTCDTPSCVAATHLISGTIAENNRDRAQRDRSFHPVGELCPAAKLTELHVREVRSYLAYGWSHSSIAFMFRVSRKTISKISHRETWSHVA